MLVKYTSNDVYKISDFIKDRRLHSMIILERSIFFFFIFFINIFLLLFSKILLFFLSFLFFLKYFLKTFLFYFKEENYSDIELYKSDYKIKNNVNFFFLPKFLIQFSKWVGFTINYFLWNFFFYYEKRKINFLKILHSYLFILLFGTSWVNLYITIKISLDFEEFLLDRGFKAFLSSIPNIIVYNFTCVFNSYMTNSKSLRIYKEYNKIYFNPNKLKIPTNDGESMLKSVKINSPKSSCSHPGIMFGKKDKVIQDTSIQMTGRIPNKDYEGVKIHTSNYKKEFSFAIYNIVRNPKNIVLDYNSKILSRVHLDNIEKMNNFREQITLLRSIKSEKTILEDINSIQVQQTNFARYCIENQSKLNIGKNLIKIYDINMNIIDRLSNKNIKVYEDFYDNIILNYKTKEDHNLYITHLNEENKENLDIYKSIKFTFKTEDWPKELNNNEIDIFKQW